MFSLTDFHCHLQDKQFDDDLDAVIQRAVAKGVRQFVCNGSNPSDWEKVLTLAKKYGSIIPCFGVHPLCVETLGNQPWRDRLVEILARTDRELASGDKKIPLGEIGLDAYFKPHNESLQESVFREQLRLAHQQRRPVMLHTLHALDRVLDLLRSEKVELPAILFHNFSSPLERLPQIIAFNGYFSFSANVLKSSHKKARHAAMTVPIDRLLLESDAPDILPPFELTDQLRLASRNEPCIIAEVLGEISSLRKMLPSELAAMVEENEKQFWGEA